MTTSALLRHGPAYAGELLDGLTSWMARKGFESLDAAARHAVGARERLTRPRTNAPAT